MRRAKLVLPVICILAIALPLAAQSAAAPAAKAGAPKSAAAAPVDKAYLQSIWDGWSSADIEKQGQFYVQGPDHLFFDVAPLKYNSWEEYKAAVAPSLKDSPKVTYTLNPDIQIHPAGNVTWVDGTLEMGGTTAQGEKQSISLRWTAVLEQQADGRWLIAHEHVSAPAEPPAQP
jgi:ketosteroid isomerase-like protein